MVRAAPPFGIAVLVAEVRLRHRHTVPGFLGLPGWEPYPSNPGRKRNEREYEAMDPLTKRRLEVFFGPHNERPYEFLGRDLGW